MYVYIHIFFSEILHIEIELYINLDLIWVNNTV